MARPGISASRTQDRRGDRFRQVQSAQKSSDRKQPPRFGIVTRVLPHSGYSRPSFAGYRPGARRRPRHHGAQIGMPHPIEEGGIQDFCSGLEEVLVVEEKRRILELAVKDVLYAVPEKDGRGYRVVATNTAGLLSEVGHSVRTRSLAPSPTASDFHDSPAIQHRLAFLEAKDDERTKRRSLSVVRTPSSVPAAPTIPRPGSRRQSGPRRCRLSLHGDQHGRGNVPTRTWEAKVQTGSACRVSSKPNTFSKPGEGPIFTRACGNSRLCGGRCQYHLQILYNDAVAMTGGQPVDGNIDPAAISRQVHAEGVNHLAIVTDQPGKIQRPTPPPCPGTEIHHRRSLDEVQKNFRRHHGVSVIIYDQTCAAEKRRRENAALPDPEQRMFINERVCEGCGDCSDKSNCLPLYRLRPIRTKRRVDSPREQGFLLSRRLLPELCLGPGRTFATLGRCRRGPPASAATAGTGPPGPVERPALQYSRDRYRRPRRRHDQRHDHHGCPSKGQACQAIDHLAWPERWCRHQSYPAGSNRQRYQAVHLDSGSATWSGLRCPGRSRDLALKTVSLNAPGSHQHPPGP
ncbi:MAG: hypothetical protein Ct9H300mP16_07790 [Pseudomonadota bacterium]|nr:MAG: hypothetical protein Ct9H300mP16_07790 [Pseudomonadota bacterium]